MATIARPASAAGTLPLGRPGRVWRRIGSLESHRSFWIALWTAGAAGELGALWPVLFGDRSGVTATEVIFRATGGSFVAAGLIAWQLRPANRVGALMVGTGFLLFVQPLETHVDSSLMQTLGVLITDWWTVPFVVLLLVFPQGRWIKGRLESLLVAAFAVPLVAQPFWMLFGAEPGLANDIAFWPNDRAADWIDKGQRGVLVAATVSLFLVVAWRWWTASAPLRRVLVPVLVGGATVLSFAVLLALDLINGTRSQTQLTITLSVLATVPLAFLAGLLRSRLARVAVGDLLVGLRDNPSPGELRDALARSLGDPSLDLVYWLPDFGKYADLDGREVALPGPGEGRAVTPIDAGGVRVAALLHDAALLEDPAMLEGATAAASIALENAQLHVELQARLDELRGSRARIVEAGQKERQRLERNLHDGAQQRLVALSLELSLLEGQVASNPDARERLDRARGEIAASLEELRELARGLHPAVVSAHGLDVALEQLAARAPVPVRLTVETDGRLPEQLEVAAFYLVSESLANVGKYAQATSASVFVRRADGIALVEVVDNGVGGADTESGSGLRGLADRVEALDGRLRVWSPQGGGTRVQAKIPCGAVTRP